MGTFGIQAGQAAVNTGSGILGGIFGLATAGINDKRQINQQQKLTDMSINANKQLAEYNYKKQLQLWEATNYASQKAQLEKAGLNPALMYGMSGGGGATAAAAQAQGSGTAQAPQGGGEIMTGMGMGLQGGMQMALLEAQRKNIEADTANKQADTANKPLTGANIQASTGNIQADTALKNANTEIAKLEGLYQEGTLEQRIANLSNDASRILAQAQSAMTKANVDRATQETAIKTIRQQYLNAIMQNNAMKQAITESAARVHKTEQEIQTIIQDRFNSTEYLQLARQGQSNEKNAQDLDRINRNISQETGMGEDVIKMIGGGMIGLGIKAMPNAPRTEDTYGEYDGRYYETHKKSY